MNPESQNSPDTFPAPSSASPPPGIPPTALAWGTVRKATSDDLPDAYDRRVHLEAIYVLTSENSDPRLVTHPPCHHCRKGRKFCDRGYPTCSLCARNGLKCARQNSQWTDLPLYKIKKNADKNDSGVKRKRLAADEAEPSDMKINPRQKQAKTDALSSEVLSDNETERPFTRSHTTLTKESRIETTQAVLKPDRRAPVEKKAKSKSSKGDSKKNTARLLSSSKVALQNQKKSKKPRETGSILEQPPHMASTVANERVKSHSKPNFTWRTAKPTPIISAPLRSLPNGRPRIWTGTYRELSVAIPALEKSTDGIVSEGYDTPILIFKSNRDKVPELGAWEGDTWEGRKITFSIARDISVPPTLGMSGLISNDLDAAHPCPSGAGSSIDLPLIPSSSASLNAEGAHIISRKPVSGNVASEASHPPSCDLKVSQDVDQLGRVSSDPQVNLVVGAASTPGPDYEDVSLRPQTYSPCNCTRVSFDPDCPDCNGFVAPTSLSYPVADQDIEMSIYSARKDDPQDGRDSDRNSIHSNIDDNEMANSVENSGAHINASPQSTGADVIPPSVPSQSGISSSAPLTMPLPASATSQLHNATLTTSFPVESIPSPPADIQALLHAHETGRPVSMIISRDAPLMPWILPDEVGYVWAGLFAVVRMKEDKLYAPSLRATSTTTLRVLWRFELEWICGGEESLKSEAQDSKEWQKTIQRPWWECTSSPSETALYSPMATDAPLTQNTVATEQDSDLINPTALDHSSPRQPFDAPIAHSLIPLPLLASFSASSSANDAFPSGYFCHNCGRVNVQRFLRHRACESAHCSVLRSRATMDQSVGGDSLESGVKEIRDDGQGWMMDVMAVRNPRLTYVCLFPDNMCLEPAVSLLRQDWGDGMRVFWYGLPSLSSLSQHMSLDGQVPPTPPIPVTPVSNLAPVTSEQVLHSDKHLVRHIFTGNLPRLQSEPTELFGRLQRDIQLERRYGETVFTKRFDSSAIIEGEGGTVVSKSITKLQEFMEYLVSTYGEEKAIKMPAIEILSWVGEGKARDVFRAKEKSLAVLCLGADVAFTFTYSDHNSKGTSAVPTKVPAKAPSVNLRNHDATSDTQDFGTKKKAKSPAVLRITLLHGDMMVLSGGDFEYFMARTGMCILAISSYVPGSRFISLPARV